MASLEERWESEELPKITKPEDIENKEDKKE